MRLTKASCVRNRKKRPKPTAVPTSAAIVDSTAESIEICRGVAPTSRIAAKRCSRRAAASRVAVPMRMSTGKIRAVPATERMSLMPELSMPALTVQFVPLQLLGVAWVIVVTWVASCCFASWSGRWPMTTIKESGPGSAALPIVPAWCPG